MKYCTERRSNCFTCTSLNITHFEKKSIDTNIAVYLNITKASNLFYVVPTFLTVSTFLKICSSLIQIYGNGLVQTKMKFNFMVDPQHQNPLDDMWTEKHGPIDTKLRFHFFFKGFISPVVYVTIRTICFNKQQMCVFFRKAYLWVS